MKTPITNRQKMRWKRLADSGDLPTEFYEMLSEGTRGMQKRQILKLAKVSRVLDEDGFMRTYDQFKLDWKYKSSVFGNKLATCFLCGKFPIMEQCIIEDVEANRTIIVGNTCAHRYVEIKLNGELLDSENKKEFLTVNMKKARDDFQREKFAKEFPSALLDLRRYQEMMTQKKYVNRKKVPMNIEWNLLHRAMLRRLLRVGYPHVNLYKQWKDFMTIGEDEFMKWGIIKSKQMNKVKKLQNQASIDRREFLQKLSEVEK
tara:strand:+ start:21248 stop:22024 length:777 start_codon:yes stop_codon:yes gene_type:complete